MKIFVHPVAYPYNIAYTVESRDVYSKTLGLEVTVWDVYYSDHFGCISQGFNTPDAALEWLTKKDDTEYFVWNNALMRTAFQDEKFLETESAIEGKVK